MTDALRLLSLTEAAAILGIHRTAVRALVERGEIGAYFTGVSEEPRIPRRSLEVWQDRIATGKSAQVCAQVSRRPVAVEAGKRRLRAVGHDGN